MQPPTPRPVLAPALRLLAAAAALAACGATGDVAYVDEALDSTESAQQQAALLLPTLPDTPLGAVPAAVAQAAASRAATSYQPPSCVTATAAGPVVTYELADCTGPHGLVHVTGTATVTFSVSGDDLRAVLSAKGLAVNGAVLDADATGLFVQHTDSKKSLQVTSTTGGTGARGHRFTHAGAYSVSWDATCLELDGTFQTRSAGLLWSSTVTKYRRCQGGCPAAGGSLVYGGGISDTTFTISFDGGATATWASSRGRSGTVNLACR